MLIYINSTFSYIIFTNVIHHIYMFIHHLNHQEVHIWSKKAPCPIRDSRIELDCFKHQMCSATYIQVMLLLTLQIVKPLKLFKSSYVSLLHCAGSYAQLSILFLLISFFCFWKGSNEINSNSIPRSRNWNWLELRHRFIKSWIGLHFVKMKSMVHAILKIYRLVILKGILSSKELLYLLTLVTLSHVVIDIIKQTMPKVSVSNLVPRFVSAEMASSCWIIMHGL